MKRQASSRTFTVSSCALENERTETLTALDGFLTGWGDLK